MATTIKTIIQVRRDTTENWLANKDTIPAAGEPCLDLDTGVVKWGDGVTTYENLKASGSQASHFEGERTGEETNEDVVARVLTALSATPEKDDVFVVKSLISEGKYSHTAYVYNGTDWVAMDGNYNANNVIFDEDFTFTTKIGTVQTLTNGSTKVDAAGKSVKEFLASIFAAESNPSRTANASVSWTTEPKGTVEVGTEVTPTYNAKFNAGSYTYGPATGLTATSWDVDVADLADANKTTNSGSFSKFTAIDGMSGYAKITAKATHSDGAIPVTNIGNKYDENGEKNVRIMAGTKSATSAGYTAYRAWFYGYKAGGSTLTVAEMDSDDVRGLTSANGSFTTSMSTTNMQQMFFAAPAGLVKSVAVAHSVNGAPQTVKQTTIYVKGNNDYVVDVDPETDANNNRNGMKYDLFYVSNDNANTGDATYTITTTKN